MGKTNRLRILFWSPAPGDTVALKRGCDRKADGLVRPALIRNDEVCVQRV